MIDPRTLSPHLQQQQEKVQAQSLTRPAQRTGEHRQRGRGRRRDLPQTLFGRHRQAFPSSQLTSTAVRVRARLRRGMAGRRGGHCLQRRCFPRWISGHSPPAVLLTALMLLFQSTMMRTVRLLPPPMQKATTATMTRTAMTMTTKTTTTFSRQHGSMCARA